MKKKRLKLKRELGLFSTTFIGVGVIIGAGIYALVGKAAGIAGNAVWISFLFAAIVAAFTGLSYAELSSMYPKDSAEYAYTKKPLGKLVAYVIAFLVLVGTVIAASAVALGFAGYLNSLIPSINLVTLAIIGLIVFGIIAFLKIELSSEITIIFSILSILGLIIIIGGGLKYFGKVDYLLTANLARVTDYSWQAWKGVFSAAALIFFAFLGFEDVVKLSEETKKPKKTIPKALILAVIICTILYTLVSISAVSVLGYKTLGESGAPLADVANKAFGANSYFILAIIALFATSSTLLILLIAASRMIYGLANEGLLPGLFSKIHKKTRTPHIAILVITLISILFLFLGKIEFVANLTNFTVFVTFVVINLSVIVLRYIIPDRKREFRTPISIGRFPVLPLLGVLFCIFMIFNLPIKEVAYGGILLLVGVLLYFVYHHGS